MIRRTRISCLAKADIQWQHDNQKKKLKNNPEIPRLSLNLSWLVTTHLAPDSMKLIRCPELYDQLKFPRERGKP